MEFGRYSRQMLFSGVGRDGQAKLAAATVVVVGLGGLGSAAADLLARAGVGRLRLVDRDYVDETNLARQTLYDEEDCRQAMPKAAAARRRLERVNSGVVYEALVTDIGPDNIEDMVRGAAVVVDGTDNFETRYLVNEACVKLGVPWVFGSCVAAEGMSFTILPGRGPCLRCFAPRGPAPGEALTCDVAGVIGPVVAAVAALEVGQALKVLVGKEDGAGSALKLLELWSGTLLTAALERNPACDCCVARRFPLLEDRARDRAVVTCGRSTVQVLPERPGRLSLDEVARRLGQLGPVTRNEYLVKVVLGVPASGAPAPGGPGRGLAGPDPAAEMVVFADGRALVKGAADPDAARDLYARYLGA